MLKTLQKPTLFQTVIGGVITIVKDSFHLTRPSLPKQIGKYTLVNDIEKERGYSYSFSLGVYEYNKKKYFIKHWQGTIKDLNYSSLVNEYLLGDLMAKKLNSVKRTGLHAPNVIEHLALPNSFSVVYEYIDGKSLSLYPEVVKSKILFDALETLRTISTSLTVKERTLFSERSLLFYVLSFFPLSLFVLLMNGKYAGTIIKSFTKSLFQLGKKRQIKYGIAHRDLDATNIVMAGNTAYLTDFETMVITLAGYDMVRLTLMPDIKKFPEYFTSVLAEPENIFLRTYILLHLSLSANAMPELRESYIEKLNN